MGLSEREQKLLEELEKSLGSAGASNSRRLSNGSGAAKRVILGVLVLVAGIGVMITAVSLRMNYLGVIAFATMLAGIFLASKPKK